MMAKYFFLLLIILEIKFGNTGKRETTAMDGGEKFSL